MKTVTTDARNCIIQFIHTEIGTAYEAEAEGIIEKMAVRLKKLQEDPAVDLENLLQTLSYPFLACADALEASGKSREEATGFAKSLWEKIEPEIFK